MLQRLNAKTSATEAIKGWVVDKIKFALILLLVPLSTLDWVTVESIQESVK